MSLPFEIVDVPQEEREARRKMYTGPASIMVDVVTTKPYGCIINEKFRDFARPIMDFEVKPDDVWMITYPKAGSTWMQETLWQITHGMDLEGGKKMIFLRTPFLELSLFSGAKPAVPSAEEGQEVDEKAGEAIKL